MKIASRLRIYRPYDLVNFPAQFLSILFPSQLNNYQHISPVIITEKKSIPQRRSLPLERKVLLNSTIYEQLMSIWDHKYFENDSDPSYSIYNLHLVHDIAKNNEMYELAEYIDENPQEFLSFIILHNVQDALKDSIDHIFYFSVRNKDEDVEAIE